MAVDHRRDKGDEYGQCDDIQVTDPRSETDRPKRDDSERREAGQARERCSDHAES
jgi:hypothetical protein